MIKKKLLAILLSALMVASVPVYADPFRHSDFRCEGSFASFCYSSL